ncbi:sensor histidine kinase KdpD [Prosthecobacter sp.]|uniref:sensor histidine kinase KdpD n=1 Tax=Prosthecobacter sp. TaxID=1965333 RepID=UPI002AB8F50F|nr:sensor histidine kinase KdpD [Prosthecobacter sp.]MDZ4401845.1 sensor histidine kinase KdpD [Prosthecobacter sp.]
MNDDQRPDPDALLAQMQQADAAAKSGKLFIFLGMCPGVGKTYAMLQTARQRVIEGVDVLAGIIETHGRFETAALLEGMTVLPRKQLEHRGFTLEEFDIDAVLAQRPQLVLVDELAHTNAPGSRHAKRYQDVLEIIDAGIDVYTTLNVQHIDSQVDIVRQVSGVAITETVPDSILDVAHEIQLIDLSVEKLLERMADGKVYLGERAELAVSNFFKEGNLTALRELALRFTAEQVDRDLEDIRRLKRVSSPWKTNARLMVGVGPSPYAESLIRWTRRAATRLNCPWIVVWVEGSRVLTPVEQDRLTRSLGLARKLGGEVVSVTGENITEALLQVARERNVSQVVVGKPDNPSLWKKSLADQLILGSGDIDVCVVRPLAATDKARNLTPLQETVPESIIGEYSWALVTVFSIASVCWGLVSITGYMFVALVFLLAVVLAALRFSRGPVMLMATLSALCWNFFFIPPQYTFYINKAEDWIMFGMFFIVAISMGSLTSRLRMREIAERRRLRQTDALLRVTQSAALAAEPEKGLAEALRTINELLNADTALVVREQDRSLPKAAHRASSFHPSPKEWGVVAWSYENKQCAGRFTDTLPESAATWFPLQTATSNMGVLGVQMPREARLDFTTRQTIEAFALQLALVLEKEHFIQAVSHAEVLAQSEKLHRTLLDSVSHELKTPLAVIHAALEGMNDMRSPYIAEINTASQRLQRVVDNLLQMTRLESEVLQPNLGWCDLRDVIAAARQAAGDVLSMHPVNVWIPDHLPLVKLDHTLLAQALANILHNAAVYTPQEATIEITASLHAQRLRLTIRDHGPGLPLGEEQRVFEKFYRAKGSPAGGTGLGLAIARGFIQAQGGDITARNHPEGGAEFVIEVERVFQLVPTAPPAAEPTS